MQVDTHAPGLITVNHDDGDRAVTYALEAAHEQRQP